MYWISSCRQPTDGRPPTWGLGEALTTPRRKNSGFVTKREHLPWTWINTLIWTKQRKMGHEVWYLQFYEPVYSRFISTAARKLVWYNLDWTCVQEFRWDNGSTLRAGNYNFFCEKWNENLYLWTAYFVPHRILWEIKRAENISDRMSHVLLRGRWFNIFLNVHAQT